MQRDTTNMKLVLATPFYEVKAYSPYIVSLIDSLRVLQELGIEYDYYELSGDSYVDRAKNILIHRFLQSDATHIFMIDSDLSWDVDGFERVIRAALAGAEVIGGAYPNKNNWSAFGVVLIHAEDGHPVSEEIGNTRLVSAWGIPGGFLVYSREAVERTRSNLSPYTEPAINETLLECFRCNIEKDGRRVSEDIYFQQRYREMGGQVWLEPDISFEHFGVKGWEGNFHNHLLAKLVKGLRPSQCAEVKQSPKADPVNE